MPALSADGVTLLLDPLAHTPVALLSDPHARLAGDRRPLVLQTVRENPDATGLPRLRLTEALPEFWAQPSVWRHFQRGVEAYAGLGVDEPPRSWAGAPATDRRAYRSDPGLKPLPASVAPAPAGGGSMNVSVATGLVQLAWSGAAGRVYELQYATSLNQPFQVVRTIIAFQNGNIQALLPAAHSQGFYRLVEISP